MTIKDFLARLKLFIETQRIVKEMKLDKYLYHKVHLYDFAQFLENMNRFYGNIEEIFAKIGTDQEYDKQVLIRKVRHFKNSKPT